MKLLSLFSGIGAFEKALDRLKIDYELVGYCEIDKYASKSYSAIHGVPESMNLGDITKVNEKELPNNIDLITYGFPCQDISLAGKQKGLFNADGTQTRSGLFFEALRIIEETQPRVAIAENVKNLTSKKFSEQFKIVLDSLENAGYNNYWKVLNAKDYGIPQNRERVFIVSIRKDIDNGMFQFTEGFPLELRLKDILEDDVDEKFYLNKNAEKLLSCNIPSDETVIKVGNINPSGKGMNGTVIDSEGLARTITQEKGEGQKILVREATKAGYAEATEGDSINLEQPNSKTRRGRVGKQVAQTLTTSPQQAVVERKTISYGMKIEPKEIEVGKCLTARYAKGFSNYNPENAVVEAKIDVIGNYSPSNHDASRIVSSDGIAPTVKENHGTVTATNVNLRIRKLTPKECFRLMGFDDEDFEKAASVNSNTQLYKQIGNSIVVACTYYIFKALIDANILTEKEIEPMELKMNEYQLPEKILFNYEELKQELVEKVSHYETLVYTDDQIKEAKTDKANLNKLKKALNDERIRREKEYMIPFNDFKSKINEIISIIDKPVAVIDKQVKEYEEKQKNEKMDAIRAFWEETPHDERLALEEVFDSKWLNASTSMKSIQESIDASIVKFNTDLATLQNLPEFSFEAQQMYISSLDINKALNEAHRLSEVARKKAEYEATQAAKLAEQMANAEFANAMNPPVEEQIPGQVEFNDPKSFDNITESMKPAKQWIAFKALLSTEDALALKEFFNSRNIEFKAV